MSTNTTYIQTPTVATNPTLVLGYAATRDVPTVLHRIIGRGDPDVTLAPVGLREGSMDLLYAVDPEYQANEAVRILSLGYVYDLFDDVTPSMNMSFVVAGRLGIRADQDTGAWIVSVPFAEVAP